MADSRAAILKATMEATRVHTKLGVRERWDRQGGRIDVFGAIDAYGLPLLFRPMDELLGAFLRDPIPGVIVSTQRPLSVRRYTAAHELGHFVLGHEPSLDDDGLLRRSPFADRADYDTREMEADAFAIAFLLPPWLAAGEMQRHGWTPGAMAEPANVYQLALRVGLSYEATCYALRRYKTINAAICTRLVKVQPKLIKQSIIPEYEAPSWYLDVWHLRRGDEGVFIEASPGDVLKISLLEHSGGGYMWDVGGLNQTDLEIVDDHRDQEDEPGMIGGHVTRRLTTLAKTVGVGSVRMVERRPWEHGVEPLDSYQFSYDIARPASPGLFAAQLERLLGTQQ